MHFYKVMSREIEAKMLEINPPYFRDNEAGGMQSRDSKK
jgi:hypothetical protein